MNNDRQYHLENIIRLQDAIFDDVSLGAFCLAHFPDVFDLFAEGMRKDQKIILLLDHCRRHGELNRLLNLVQDINSYQFGRFEPYHKKARIFISYKRDTKPDHLVALEVYEALKQEHDVFIDQNMLVGEHWAERLKNELHQSDYLITFLSVHSVHSEMVLAEVEMAHHLAKENGRPTILPVRLAYREPFHYPLSVYLDPINWAFWRNPMDNLRIIDELKHAIAGEPLPVGPRYKPTLIKPPDQSPPIPPPIPPEPPEGTMYVDSPFYVERPSDGIALREIQRQGVTFSIIGSRQMGKSSLLMRVINTAKETQKKEVVFLDFQLFDKSSLADANAFFRQFCTWLTLKLKVEDRVDEFWQMNLPNNLRCTNYMEHLLNELDRPLVLAMDEVDTIFGTDFRSDFFGMVRGWNNSRSEDPRWKQLDLVLVTSTEPFLFIENPHQSPFNVGEKIRLDDFTAAQVADLNRHHSSPLTPIQMDQLMALLRGHPYLVRRALYLVADNRISISDLFAQASEDNGPFGDHLRYYAFRLHGYEDLSQGLRQIVHHHTCQDDRIAYRLQGAGLVRREGRAVVPRCQLYADYFGEHLP